MIRRILFAAALVLFVAVSPRKSEQEPPILTPEQADALFDMLMDFHIPISPFPPGTFPPGVPITWGPPR